MPHPRPKPPEGRLTTRTRELLTGSIFSLREIEAATGISNPWLSQFATGKIANPSANRVELLYTYLSGTPIVLDVDGK